MKLELPTVTAVCADCVDADRAIAALEKSTGLCNFGAVKLLTSKETSYPHTEIRPLNSLNDYSAFMMKELYLHIDTPHMLTIQHDGWVLHPETWQDHWLNYDYMGPLFLQETEINDQTVGSGGFSLRSTRLMKAVCDLLPPWDGNHSYDGTQGDNWAHEDGVICKHLRLPLLSQGMVFGPVDDAAKFAYGGNQHAFCPAPFGFHGFWPENILEVEAQRYASRLGATGVQSIEMRNAFSAGAVCVLSKGLNKAWGDGDVTRLNSLYLKRHE